MEPSWLLYLGIGMGPFVQEDAAVLAAATLSASNPRHFPLVFFVILGGLILSDIWKYWIGWAALKNPSAKAFTEKKHVANLKDKVQRHLFLTLLGTRFLPLARIPAYVACGYFRVPYIRFCSYIAISATLYTISIFVLCYSLGEVVGDKLERMLPLAALTLLVVFGSVFWGRQRQTKSRATSITDVSLTEE